MDIEYLVQMKQSIKCGSVVNDETFNLRLGLVSPLRQHSLPPGRQQTHLLNLSSQKINHKKATNSDISFNSLQMF